MSLTFSANVFAERKVDKNVKYGPHKRNVLDVYWNTEYRNAPIVFTIHGGSFRRGDKGMFCNNAFLDMVCYSKGTPKGGGVINVGKKKE